MTVRIRQEKIEDIPLIHDLIGQAFESVLESDHKEPFLVDRLRGSEAFVPQLSLVAETVNGVIVGYILLTEVEIVSQNSASVSLNRITWISSGSKYKPISLSTCAFLVECTIHSFPISS